MFELLNKIVIQQAVFELIDGTASLRGEGFEPDPDQKGTGDMIALNAGLPTLALFQPRYLFPFAVQLLDLPAYVTHCLGSVRGVSSWIVGHNPVRARLDATTRNSCT